MTNANQQTVPPGISHLAALAPLTPAARQALDLAARQARTVKARGELQVEGREIRAPMILLSGWACRAFNLADGRRQIASLLLPGDLIGMYNHEAPIANASVIALTEVVVCEAPQPRAAADLGGLAEAYAISAALEEAYLLRNITRLGRMDAYERIGNWLLELRERLALAGIGSSNQFPMPLTQEVMADTLGLTSVHINRTLQQMRKDNLIALQHGVITLADPARLATLADHRPARVSAAGSRPEG